MVTSMGAAPVGGASAGGLTNQGSAGCGLAGGATGCVGPAAGGRNLGTEGPLGGELGVRSGGKNLMTYSFARAGAAPRAADGLAEDPVGIPLAALDEGVGRPRAEGCSGSP